MGRLQAGLNAGAAFKQGRQQTDDAFGPLVGHQGAGPAWSLGPIYPQGTASVGDVPTRRRVTLRPNAGPLDRMGVRPNDNPRVKNLAVVQPQPSSLLGPTRAFLSKRSAKPKT